jgi:hypothetical protein
MWCGGIGCAAVRRRSQAEKAAFATMICMWSCEQDSPSLLPLFFAAFNAVGDVQQLVMQQLALQQSPVPRLFTATSKQAVFPGNWVQHPRLVVAPVATGGSASSSVNNTPATAEDLPPEEQTRNGQLYVPLSPSGTSSNASAELQQDTASRIKPFQFDGHYARELRMLEAVWENSIKSDDNRKQLRPTHAKHKQSPGSGQAANNTAADPAVEASAAPAANGSGAQQTSPRSRWKGRGRVGRSEPQPQPVTQPVNLHPIPKRGLRRVYSGNQPVLLPIHEIGEHGLPVSRSSMHHSPWHGSQKQAQGSAGAATQGAATGLQGNQDEQQQQQHQQQGPSSAQQEHWHSSGNVQHTQRDAGGNRYGSTSRKVWPRRATGGSSSDTGDTSLRVKDILALLAKEEEQLSQHMQGRTLESIAKEVSAGQHTHFHC